MTEARLRTGAICRPLVPAQAGNQIFYWIPAYAGTSGRHAATDAKPRFRYAAAE